jgi:hypothetical protein
MTTMRARLIRVLDSAAFENELGLYERMDAILAALSVPTPGMIEAATNRQQGPDDSLYGTIFAAMINSVRRGA